MSWRHRAAAIGASERLDTRTLASCGRPRCRECATCVLDPERKQRRDDRRSNSSAPGCGLKLRVVRGSLADHTAEAKKTLSCVTTRRHKFWLLNNLGRSPGSLPALSLCLGVADSGRGILTTSGLPPRCLPALYLSPTLGLLAISLIPAARHVSSPTPFAQADPRARSARSG